MKRKNRHNLIRILLLFSIFLLHTPQDGGAETISVSSESEAREALQNKMPGVGIFAEDFNSLSGSFPGNGDKFSGSDFWFEGEDSGATASFSQGRLEVDAYSPGAVGTVWLDQVFSKDLRVEFDVHVIDSINDSNNMNFFFLFTDKTGEPLYKTRLSRLDGQYSKYHGGSDQSADLTGYIFTHVANGNPQNPRYRLRDVPKFDPFIVEKFGVLSAQKGKTYKVVIEKIADRIIYAVDGTVILNVIDNTKNPVHSNGLIAFRTWQTHLYWDNLKITQLGEE